MCKKLVLILLLLAMCLTLFAQEGKYQRKSISTVESVWIKKGALKGIDQFDYAFFDKMVKFYIQIDRFDYNQLPEPLLKDFRAQANSAGALTPQALADIMNQTIGTKIKEILEDPAIQEQRGKDLKDQSWGATFAGSKGKSMGLTVEELAKLMNSAYVYLPYISSMEMTEKEGKISVMINGGIVWYQVKVAPDGKVNMELRVASTTMGIGSSDRNPKQVMGIKADYSHFDFGTESLPTTVEQYAQYDAVQAWAKNLGVKTKEIEEFKLSAQIADTRGGGEFGVGLGFKEGVHLDDGFFILENYETSDGKLKTKKVGFARITKTADNRENTAELSTAKLFYGKANEGSVISEHPRLGIDMNFKTGFQTGMNIPKNALSNMGLMDIYEEDATDQLVFNLGFAYNLAPIIGVSQTFLDIELGYGIPTAEQSENYENMAMYTLSAYGGLSRKFWFGRNALHANVMGGYDRFSMDWSDVWTNDYVFTINAYGVKAGCDYTFMINQDLKFTAGADYKLGMMPTGISYEVNDETIFDGQGDLPSPMDEIRLGGLMLRAGVSYSLGELPINLFGWLDPFKRY
ncbi:MAG TPA: hypothetical protein PK816_07155 [Candidatus Cloacimonadota bacterium]|nr:hypothetical protein [Candidatus Cloacimonadota bacterium]